MGTQINNVVGSLFGESMKFANSQFCLVVLAASATFALGPDRVDAATIAATSCSSSNVQTAIDAANNGDTIVIPGGSCTWSTRVTVNASAKNLNLKGSGVGATTIAVGIAPMLSINGGQGFGWTLSDMTIVANFTGQNVINVGGGSKAWRIHHVAFAQTGRTLFLITVDGDTYGVVDHITVSGDVTSIIDIFGNEMEAWTDPLNSRWGDERAVFLEDSTIAFADDNQGRFVIDSQAGGRYVIRHNTIQNQRLGNHGLDSGHHASGFSGEIYNNTFTYTSAIAALESPMHLRGGSMLFHDNVISYSSSTWVSNNGNLLLKNYRAEGQSSDWPDCDGARLTWASILAGNWANFGPSVNFSTTGTYKMCSGNRMRACTSDATCTTNGEGSCSEYVDGTAGSGTYPCFQQVGRGVNNMPSPLYEWNNTWSGGQGGSSCISVACDVNYASGTGTLFQANRDFYTNTQPSGYVPYPYPHPLTGSGGAAPPSPSNLRVIQ